MLLFRLLLLFCLVPLIELALLLMLADVTQWWFSLGLVIVTGIVGSWLARQQGWRCFQRIGREMQQGGIPADALLDGLMIFLAGALLITPGILTDLVGFWLLVPAGRRAARRWTAAWFRRKFRVDMQSTAWRGSRGEGRDEVIDVQFVDQEKSKEDDALEQSP